jgi:hypothetical protein
MRGWKGYESKRMRLKVLTVMYIQILIYQVMIPSRLVGYQHFRGTYCLHLHGTQLIS